MEKSRKKDIGLLLIVTTAIIVMLAIVLIRAIPATGKNYNPDVAYRSEQQMEVVGESVENVND